MAQQRQNRSRRKAAKPTDMWRAVPEAPDPDDITPAVEPTALLRSLGDPPLHGQRVTAGHYLAAVIERAAALATGLAASADLLAPESGDDEIDEVPEGA
jgi:hypothetical protein